MIEGIIPRLCNEKKGATTAFGCSLCSAAAVMEFGHPTTPHETDRLVQTEQTGYPTVTTAAPFFYSLDVCTTRMQGLERTVLVVGYLLSHTMYDRFDAGEDLSADLPKITTPINVKNQPKKIPSKYSFFYVVSPAI